MSVATTHPTGYETMESEPRVKRGARSRNVKQSRPQRRTIALEERVLQFLEVHADEPITYHDIARGSGANYQQVGRVVNKLVADGAVVRSGRSRYGIRYWINGSLPKGDGKNTEPLYAVASNRKKLDVDAIKTKVFNAARETRFVLATGFREMFGRNK